MSYATEDSLERWGISQSIDERTVPCTHQLATPAGQGFQATLGIGRWVPGQPLAVPTSSASATNASIYNAAPYWTVTEAEVPSAVSLI
jgi:hypothetical protein